MRQGEGGSKNQEILRTSYMCGPQDMWTVVGDTGGGGEKDSGLPDGHGHSFLILSRYGRFMITLFNKRVKN